MYKKFGKRTIDFIAALFGLIIVLPILFICSLAILINYGSPILFSQLRPGRGGKIFKLHKLRTMAEFKDDSGELLPDFGRVTQLGTLLRNASIDELPSLFNVLKGDMSLVGPRPLLVEYLPLYSKNQARRHDVKPGITGWAQVNGRNSISWEEKFELDTWYVDNYSFIVDLQILLATVKKVLMREGINFGTSITMEKFRGK